MDAVNYTDLRQNLKNHLDRVYRDHDPLIVTRKNKQNIVLVSLEDYNSLIETQYLLSSENNSKRLQRSLKDARGNQVFEKKLLEE